LKQQTTTRLYDQQQNKQAASSFPSSPSSETMQDAINILAISKKGKSRIGTKLTTAIVEQNHHDKLFLVFPELNQCRWIKKDNDPDFRIIGED
jgi:hypothetical protein